MSKKMRQSSNLKTWKIMDGRRNGKENVHFEVYLSLCSLLLSLSFSLSLFLCSRSRRLSSSLLAYSLSSSLRGRPGLSPPGRGRPTGNSRKFGINPRPSPASHGIPWGGGPIMCGKACIGSVSNSNRIEWMSWEESHSHTQSFSVSYLPVILVPRSYSLPKSYDLLLESWEGYGYENG